MAEAKLTRGIGLTEVALWKCLRKLGQVWSLFILKHLVKTLSYFVSMNHNDLKCCLRIFVPEKLDIRVRIVEETDSIRLELISNEDIINVSLPFMGITYSLACFEFHRNVDLLGLVVFTIN